MWKVKTSNVRQLAGGEQQHSESRRTKKRWQLGPGVAPLCSVSALSQCFGRSTHAQTRDSRQLGSALRWWPRDRPGCWVTGRWRRRSPVREMPPPRPETQKPARAAAAARWWESVSRCWPGPGSLDGVTRWLSLNDGLVFNCRPWWAQLAQTVLPGAVPRQNLFADGQFVARTAILWFWQPLCNSAPRPRNQARVHAHKAQAVKVSSVHDRSLPLQKVNKNSSSGERQELFNRQKSRQKFCQWLFVVNYRGIYWRTQVTLTTSLIKRRDQGQQLGWLNIHHIVIIWFWSYVGRIFIEFFSQLYFPLSREKLINNLSF